MKLLGSLRSPYCRKVMVVAHELGLAEQIELVPAMVASTTANPEVLACNPLGKIPVLLKEDGEAFYDSLVICLYLDTLQPGGRFVPADKQSYLRAMQWHALGQGLTDVVLQWNRERMRPPEKQTEGYSEVLCGKVLSSLSALDGMCGSFSAVPFGLGHAAISSALGYLDFRFDSTNWRRERGMLSEWFAQIAQRPSMMLTQPI